jgi:hypothetical protein
VTSPEAADPTYLTLLAAASANVSSGAAQVFDAGDLKDELTLEVVISGTVSAYSVALQGSIDGVNFVALGIPNTSAGAAGSAIGPVTQSTGPLAISSGILARYFRASLASYSGTGTITAELAFGAGL